MVVGYIVGAGGMRYFIFSDLHLGDPDSLTADFACVIKSLRDDDRIIIVGDGIEGWVRDWRMSIIKYFKLIQKIYAKLFLYVVGNHDSVLKWLAWMQQVEHARFVYPSCVIEIDGKRWYLEHGHLAGQWGFLFKFLDRFDNTFLFNKIAEWVYKRKKFSMSTRSVSDKSRMKQDIAKRAKQCNASVAIVGHDHLPSKDVIDGVLVIDPGTAVKKFTYVIYEDGEFTYVNF